MIVTVTRSGGFAGGNPRIYRIDTSLLGDSEAKTIEAMLEALPRDAPPPSLGADMYQYDIEAAQDGRSRKWRFFGDPNPATALIERVAP